MGRLSVLRVLSLPTKKLFKLFFDISSIAKQMLYISAYIVNFVHNLSLYCLEYNFSSTVAVGISVQIILFCLSTLRVSVRYTLHYCKCVFFCTHTHPQHALTSLY